MRLITVLSSFIFLSCFDLKAQDDLLNTKQKFFSLRQAKLSVGLGLEGGGAKFIGNLPIGYQAKRDTTTFLASVALFFDINAPNSRLSFTSGIETSNQGLLFVHDSTSEQKSVRIRQIHIPLLLKYKMGKKFSGSNVLLLVGGSYNIPITYSSKDNNNFVENDIKSVQNTYSWISAIVWQLNIRGKKSNIGTNVPPRMWLYFESPQSGMVTGE